MLHPLESAMRSICLHHSRCFHHGSVWGQCTDASNGTLIQINITIYHQERICTVHRGGWFKTQRVTRYCLQKCKRPNYNWKITVILEILNQTIFKDIYVRNKTKNIHKSTLLNPVCCVDIRVIETPSRYCLRMLRKSRFSFSSRFFS